jgi:amino-acid N-acetyltransferase
MFAIRAPGAEDLPALKTFLDDCGLPSSDLTVAHLDDFLILSQSRRVLGSIGMEKFGSDALLRSLAIDNVMRGEGLAKRLLEEMESTARDCGVSRLYLLTTSADRFFEHHGYQRIDRSSAPASIQNTTQFASICPASAICLFKPIA